MDSLKDIKQYAKEHNVPIIMDEGLQVVVDTFQSNECHSFLELGTAVGRTSLIIASLDANNRVVTIERNPEMIAQAKQNFLDSDYTNQITLIEGDALDVEITGQYDCIFIDAAKSQYIRFFEKYSPMLKENGIIITDNMKFHGLVDHPERTGNRNTRQLVGKIRKYRDYLTSLEDYVTEFIDQGDGLAITRRKKNGID